ncbi:hypothetical protein KAS14_03210 [Candidatus Bathyarchaeota archaeon]|nr:hypothetical protein [Candidatus Bathyarchaeota archaeon]
MSLNPSLPLDGPKSLSRFLLFKMLPFSLPDNEDIVNFIVTNYGSAKKIVEIGVGANPLVAKRIKVCLPSTKVVVTDIDREKLIYTKKAYPELEPVYDNILRPQMEVYIGADLIYSLRPPTELVSEIFQLASRISCDVLIRPFFNEEGGYDYPKRHGWKFKSHGQAILYWLKRDHL